MYDLLIRNARIIDGTGAPWYYGDLAVKDGVIAAMGKLGSCDARETVDAAGLALSPGFIDIHCHSDETLLNDARGEGRLLQGVTLEIGGNCGMSMAPAQPETLDLLRDYMGPAPYDWNTFGQFLDRIEAAQPSVNFGCLVGHGTLRIAVMGFSAEKATDEQCAAMRQLAEQAMEEGAFGVTSGLIYPPGSFSDTRELAEVAKAVLPYGGYYATHMRNERNALIPALEEALETARLSGAPLHISHHKCAYKPHWESSVGATIPMIRKAREQGLDVTCDQYPYNAGSTTITCNFPSWAFEGGMEALLARLRDPEARAKMCAESDESHLGRWGDIHVGWTACPEDQWMCGKNMIEIGEKEGLPPVQALAELVLRANGQANELDYCISERDIEFIMQQPFVMIGSDGWSYPLSQPGKPHPRAYGTFPRILGHYSRDRRLFPLETAVFKMTGMPAARLGLSDRGLLRPGMKADLVLFDPETVRDDPTYQNPQQPCTGIKRVYVNGVLSACDGQHTGARAGIVLRKGKNT